MTRLPMTLILLAALSACSSDTEQDTMLERSDEVAACVEVLVQNVYTHGNYVMRADDLMAIDMMEEQHYYTVSNKFDDLDYWLGQVNLCSADGVAPDTAVLTDVATMAAREAALHRLSSALATTADQARAEEERYQVAMMGYLGTMRLEYIALDEVALDFTCPIE